MKTATMKTASMIDNITATIGAQFAFITDRVYDADRPQRITCTVIDVERESWEAMGFADTADVTVEVHDHARQLAYRVTLISDILGRIQPQQVLAAYDRGGEVGRAASVCYKPEAANA